MGSDVQTLITEHIDLWTSAIQKKKSAGRGSSKKHNLYGIKKLRELILELAVRGKLVPQDPNDEPASVLLERIAEERDRLVKEKKIKKPKTLPAITAEEQPFELPTGWAFTRIGDLTSKLGSGSTPRGGKSAYVEQGVPFLRSQNIWNDGLKLDDIAYIPHETHEKMENTKVIPGDVLLNITGASLGRSAIFPAKLDEANVSQHVTIIRLIEPDMGGFIHLGILSPLVQKLVWGRQVGMAIEGLSKKVLEAFEYPVPPLKEQQRIVAKVDELMALCDQLEAQTENNITAHQLLVETLLGTLTQSQNADELAGNWQRLAEHFDTLFTTEHSIDQLKQTILQLAVMGKLVPQDPNDEPASVLLERIATEKKQLIKDKKIKKQKALPPIAEDEKQFSLPDGWEWVKFGKLASFINGDRGKNYPNKNEYVAEGVPWINTGHIKPNGLLTTTDMNFITEEKYEILRSGKIIDGDLVYCLRGATFGKTAFVEPYEKGAIASSLMIIRPHLVVLRNFVYQYLISPFGRSQIFRFDNGSAQPNLSANSVMLYAFPLPPENEQQKIIVKITELFSLCDQLKARLQESQQTQLSLAEAITDQALQG